MSLAERVEIQVCLSNEGDASFADIGRCVGRDRSTISREVRANGGRSCYRAEGAERRAKRSLSRPRVPVLVAEVALGKRVKAELGRGRSPAAIAADLRPEPASRTVCHETIYTAVYNGTLGVKARDCLRWRRPRRRRRQERHTSKRPGVPNISKRPEVVNNRAGTGRGLGSGSDRRERQPVSDVDPDRAVHPVRQIG